MTAPLDLTSPGPRISGRRHGAWTAEARELIRLAVPLAATQLAQMIILATDIAMLGHLSKQALAASALGNTVFFMAWLLGSGLPFAVSPVIAHVQGRHSLSLSARPRDQGASAGRSVKRFPVRPRDQGASARRSVKRFAIRPRDQREVRIVVRMGFWSVVLATPPLLIFLLFTRQILEALGEDRLLAADAGHFVGALSFGLPFALGFMVLRSFSTALSRAVPPMMVMLAAILFNAAGDYALIFGHFGLPRLGLVGAGLASAGSNLFSFVVMLAISLTLPGLRQYRIWHRMARPHWATLAELIRLGLPIGITNIFEVALFNGATLAMGAFGLASIAAHQIAITIPSLTFMVPLGIGLAATVRVGLAAGAGDIKAARRAGLTALGLGGLFMCGTAILLLLFPRAIATLWLPDTPDNAEVLALAVSFLYVAAAFQLADGLQVTAAMSLRGLKDTRAPMWIAGASYWLMGAPMCALLGFGLGFKGFGIWLGLAFGLFMAACLLTSRFLFLSKRSITIQ